MILQLEKLGDFNKVIEYYKFMLAFTEILDPSKRGKKDHDLFLPELGYPRATINNVGISIAQNFELLERKIENNEVSEDEVNKRIMYELGGGTRSTRGENLLTYLEGPLKKIMENNGLTPFQTLKQIRNSLLHGNYSLEYSIDEEVPKTFIEIEEDKRTLLGISGDITVHLKGNKMEGELNYFLLKEILEYLYDKLRDICATDKRVWFISDPKYYSCKNDSFLNQYLKSMKIFHIKTLKEGEPSNLDAMLKQYPYFDEIISTIRLATGHTNFEIEELSEEESDKRKNFLKSYINYIGKEHWKNIINLPPRCQKVIFEDIMLRSSFEDYSNVTGLSNRFCFMVEEYQKKKLLNKPIEKEIKDGLATSTFEVPTLYANMLLGMASYAAVFLKENNNDTDIPLFEYHNIDAINDVQLLIDTGKEPSIQKKLPGSSKKQKYNNYIKSLKAQLKKLKASAKGVNKAKSQLNDDNPQKDKLEEKYDGILKDLNDQMENVRKRIDQMDIRSQEYDSDYTDCSEFVRHMRNSIAHGNVRINFDKAFKKKDLSRIEFTFCDYPEGQHETPEFMVTLTAKKLLQIIEGIQNRVNLQLTNELKTNHIDETEVIKHLGEAVEVQNKEKSNGDRPKETGLSPERIEEGVYSTVPLETEKVEETKK